MPLVAYLLLIQSLAIARPCPLAHARFRFRIFFGIQAIIFPGVSLIFYDQLIFLFRFIFWSRGCIKKANYEDSNITCLVNVTTNQFALDYLTSRLCYLEKSGEVHCVNYDGTNNQVS